MSFERLKTGVNTFAAASALFFLNPAAADSVWHCSRQPASQDSLQEAIVGSKDGDAQVIGLALNDLIDAYSGRSVRLGGAPLTACFMRGTSAWADHAMQSLGLGPSQVQALARRNALVQSPMKGVHSEADMASCIANNFPAVGYLPRALETNAVTQCF